LGGLITSPFFKPIGIRIMKIINEVKYFTTEEAAVYIGLTRQTIINYVKTGKLPKRKIGSHYHFTEPEIQSLIQLPDVKNENG